MLSFALVVVLAFNGTSVAFTVDHDLTGDDCAAIVESTSPAFLALLDPAASAAYVETDFRAAAGAVCVPEYRA